MLTISKLGKRFGLSRATILYYERLGRYREAMTQYLRALVLKPDFPEARKSLDIVQNRMKQLWHVSQPSDQATRSIRREI